MIKNKFFNNLNKILNDKNINSFNEEDIKILLKDRNYTEINFLDEDKSVDFNYKYITNKLKEKLEYIKSFLDIICK